MTRARCDKHLNESRRPNACPICTRIATEHRIVKLTVDALLQAGYTLQVNDGDSVRPTSHTGARSVILAELAETDDDTLLTRKTDETGRVKISFVRFVYGNDGYDVIADYGMSLDSILEPIIANAETL